MADKISIAIDDLGSSFIAALRIWSRHLEGELDWDHQVAAAHTFFTEILGAPWSPGRPPTDEEMASLEQLAPIMDTWKQHPRLLTGKLFAAVVEAARPGIEYVKASMGVDVVAMQYPEPAPNGLANSPSFDLLLGHFHLRAGDEANEFSGGVAARADGVQPTGFPIKGNMDSMKYHMPDGQGYRQTIAEVWFADEESALKGGFKRVAR